jgi:hypothetical protein
VTRCGFVVSRMVGSGAWGFHEKVYVVVMSQSEISVRHIGSGNGVAKACVMKG